MARGKKRKRTQHEANFDDETVTHQNYQVEQPTVAGAHWYSARTQLPWDLQPYWKHRLSMFSRYDQGIWTTDDSWFEVTHESIATKIAQHVAAARPANKQILLDCFAGIGGNAIAFALSGVYKRVYAIEKDLATLKCAEHNARIYGVHDRITFFHGDCFELLGLDKDKGGEHAVKVLRDVVRTFGVIFASPPWGGPGYKDAGNVFDLDLMPYSMDYLYRRFSEITKHIILYLPRTSDLNQIAQAVEEGEKAQVVHYCIHENSKALCAYLGAWGKIADDSVRS